MRRTIATLMVIAAVRLVSAATDTTLAIPGRVNATPWIASQGADVAVAWAATADGKGDIYVAMSRDSGRSFGSPVRVNANAGEARVSGEIAPRVSLSRQQSGVPIVSVTWNAKDGATQIKTARSTDGGKTFGPAISVQSPGAAGDRGWQAAATDASGRLHVIWLDHRGMAASADHAMHKGEHDGVAMAQMSGLYYRGGAPERELFKGVCYCCKTALAIGPGNEIYAAWRHVFAGNMRDMAFTVSRDGGMTFAPLVRVNQDGWSIQGCPDDGPAMAVDVKGVVHLVWPTVKNEQGVILYASSKDGRAFSAPVQVPTLGGPKPSHPQIAIDQSGTVFVAWDESRNGIRTAAVTRLGATAAPERLGASTMYPVLGATEAGIVAAWTSGPPDRSTIGVRLIQ